MSQVNITLNTNTIDVNTTNNQIVVTDPTNPTAVNVVQPVTQLVEVITSGPQGPQGIPGDPSSLTGSFVSISSFNNFTSSYYQDSSSFDIRIDNLEQFSSSLDATFATDAQLNAATASLSSSISSLSSSFTIFSGSYNTGSFTGTFSGSFSGSGANLFNIPASGIVGLNLSQISSGSVSASISPNSGLQVNTNVTATSFTGSLRGTASFAVSSSTTITSSYALSASYSLSSSYAVNATTASNILGGKATHIPFFITDTTLATSSLYQSGSSTVIINQDNATAANPEALYVWQPSTTSFNVISGKGNLNNYLQLNIQNTNQGTNASSDVVATADNGNENINYIDMGINGENYNTGFIGEFNDAYLYSTGRHLHIGNTSNFPVQIFAGGSDVDVYNKLELSPNNQHLMSGSLDVSGSIQAFSFTGSLQGNASTATIATTSISASHAIIADSANFATTAGNGGVTSIIAGSGITLPFGGTGAVTIVAGGGGGGFTIISGSAVTSSFVNSSTWTFNHNLGTRTPTITVFDSDYNQIIPENIQLVDSSSATITFPTLESGFAIASTGGTSGTALSASYSLFSTYAASASYFPETDPVFVSKSGSLATTGSNIFRGNQTVTGSITVTAGITGSLNGTATTASFVTSSNVFGPFGSNSIISSSFAVSSSITVSSSFALTASYADNTNLLDGKDSTIFATTGSNIFRDNQTITGSIFVTGSNTLIGNQTITGSILMSGSSFISGVDYIDFDTTASNVGAVGRLKWNDTDGTLDLGLKGGNVTLQLGQEEVVRVVNKTGVNLTEAGYQVVRLDGAQGGRIKVALAKGDGDANSLDTLGLVTENITNNEEGFVTTYGLVRGINTTGNLQTESWSDGDALYLSPTTFGSLTNILPTAPSHSVRMGYVVQANPGNGSIFVKVDNGYELDELHNVYINTSSLAYGDLLMRGGNNVWVNTKQLSGSYSITGSLTVSGSGTFTNIGPAVFIGNQTVTGSLFTSGSNTLIGSTTLTGSLNITGSTTQTGNNTLIGTTTLSGSINVSGSQTFYGSSSFYGAHLLSGSNTIRGNTFMFGNIQVSGSSNFNNSEFTVTGSTSILGNFNVKGTSTFSDTTFTITGSQLFSGSSNINGNQSITGSLNVIGNINVVSGSSFTRWGNKLFNYGQFANTASIPATQNVSASFNLPLTYFNDGISITSGSRITFANTGLYNIQYVATANQGSGTPNLRLWFRKTGSNVDNSAALVQLQNNSQTALTYNFASSFNAGEYVELWYHTNTTNTSFPYTAAGSGFPATPSIIVTVTQIA
jgi:hypothetical protein